MVEELLQRDLEDHELAKMAILERGGVEALDWAHAGDRLQAAESYPLLTLSALAVAAARMLS